MVGGRMLRGVWKIFRGYEVSVGMVNGPAV